MQAFDPAAISARFQPLADPSRVRGMIIGDDLDSLLSAMYLQQRFGWKVAGVFCKYTWLWHVDDRATFVDAVEAGHLIGVDLDLCHRTIPSIGHHVRALAGEPTDQAVSNLSLNPNTWRNISVAHDFRHKYPLSTLHLLYWLMNESVMLPREMRLMWLADSSYINAQQYKPNVTDWVARHLHTPLFLEHIAAIQTAAWEAQLFDMTIKPLLQNSLCKPNPMSKYRSQHLKLSGYQCQWSDPVEQNAQLQDLCDRLADLSGWRRLAFPSHFNGMIEGVRHVIPTDVVATSGMSLGRWLYHADVFSYAFVYRNVLNFTELGINKLPF
jgi:hypothetical protein